MPKYIDAEEMRVLLEEEIEGCGYPISENNPVAYGTKRGLKTALRYIEKLMTADVAPVIHAHWIGTEYDGYADGHPVYDTYECSNCRNEIDTDGYEPMFDYCPKCGAKMDEEFEEEDDD